MTLARVYKSKVRKMVKTRATAAMAIHVVRRQLARNIETKQSNQTSSDGHEILHNNFVTLNSTLLQTTTSVQDPMTSAANNRIGEKKNLRGVKTAGRKKKLRCCGCVGSCRASP